jgi:PKHD-type hydroxylase
MNGGLRSDLSVTVLLSDPLSYDGGELEIEGEPFPFKLAAGSAVIYPTSALHQVLPVTRGERLAAVFWIESHVRDEAKRAILRELREVYNWLRTVQDEAPETLRLGRLQSALLRRWMD